MLYLNLDETFAKREPAIAFRAFAFSGGEPHLKIEPFPGGEPVTILTRIRSFNDMGLLLAATDALRRMDVREISVVIPYFPAARQDRVMIPGEPLTVKIYADLLDAQGYNNVTIFDAHSDVAPALIDRVIAVPNHAFVKTCIGDRKDYVLISPDGGALKKIYKVSEYLGGAEVVECSKHRDVKTGKLSHFSVYADDLAGRDCFIIDDICDGGGTFTGLAEQLKKHGAGNIFLIVSHGIFSKGFAALDAAFSHIWCTDSFKNSAHPTLTQLPVQDFLL